MDLRQYRPKLICPAAEIVAVPRLDTVVVHDAHGLPHTIYQAGLFDSPVPEPGDWLLWVTMASSEHRWVHSPKAEFAGWEQIVGASLT